MTLNLSDENMQGAVAAAIVQTLTVEKRDELLKSAIVTLLTPANSGYGREKRSPLQDAFEQCVHQFARQTILKKLEDDGETRQMIEGVVTDAVKKAFEESREATVERLAGNLRDWLSNDR